MKARQQRSYDSVTKKEWEEFHSTGLFWLINSVLHVFGWAIVYEMDEGEIKKVYPARVKYRGYSPEVQEQAHKMIADYLSQNIEELKEETKL
jgi:hypothetical protein